MFFLTREFTEFQLCTHKKKKKQKEREGRTKLKNIADIKTIFVKAFLFAALQDLGARANVQQ